MCGEMDVHERTGEPAGAPPRAAFPDRRVLPSPGRRAGFALLGAACVLMRAATWPRRALARRRPGDALILEPFGMGDALLLQPLVRSLLAAGRRVAFAGRPAWRPLFPAVDGFAYVEVFPAWARPDLSRKYRRPVADLLATARTLAPWARGVDCIEPRGDPRAILALYLAGARSVRTLPRYWSANDCRLPPGAARFVPLDRRVSRREVSRAFAPKGVPYGRPDVSHLLPSPAPVPDPRRIGLVPLTPWEGKRWPPEHWRALVAALRDRGFSPVLLCGHGERAEVLAACGFSDPGAPPSANSADSACETHAPAVRELDSVSAWPEALAACGAVVSVNTGPMHVADALGIPLVVADGASRLPLWAPEGPRSVVLHHQERVPGAPFHPTPRNGLAVQRAIMALVTPDEVLSALSSLLPASLPSPSPPRP